jgi:hypothetical protein
MTHVTAIRVDDEENVDINSTNRLDSNLSVRSAESFSATATLMS